MDGHFSPFTHLLLAEESPGPLVPRGEVVGRDKEVRTSFSPPAARGSSPPHAPTWPARPPCFQRAGPPRPYNSAGRSNPTKLRQTTDRSPVVAYRCLNLRHHARRVLESAPCVFGCVLLLPVRRWLDYGSLAREKLDSGNDFAVDLVALARFDRDASWLTPAGLGCAGLSDFLPRCIKFCHLSERQERQLKCEMLLFRAPATGQN